MPALEGQIEPANEDDEEDADGEENARDEMYDSDRDSDNQSTDSYEADNIGWEDRVRETELTDESEGECEGEEKERGDTIDMGETVVCGADDDPQRLTWTRIKNIYEDAREGPREATFFKNVIIDDRTPELDIFCL
jgi:hypothetical protein